MKHYRIRLMIGSACASAALTVLSLAALGWLQPRTAPPGLRLTAGTTQERADLSPLRIDCRAQPARLKVPGDGKPLYLLDDHGRLLVCVQATAAAE